MGCSNDIKENETGNINKSGSEKQKKIKKYEENYNSIKKEENKLEQINNNNGNVGMVVSEKAKKEKDNLGLNDVQNINATKKEEKTKSDNKENNNIESKNKQNFSDKKYTDTNYISKKEKAKEKSTKENLFSEIINQPKNSSHILKEDKIAGNTNKTFEYIFWIDKNIDNSEYKSYLEHLTQYEELSITMQLFCLDNLEDIFTLMINYINFKNVFIIIRDELYPEYFYKLKIYIKIYKMFANNYDINFREAKRKSSYKKKTSI